jgi:hypothetical protein
MPRTDESGYGLWPTPLAQEAKHGTVTDWEKTTDHTATRNSLRVHVAKKMWPTAHGFSPDGKSNGPSGNELGRAVNRSLWPTPDLGMAKGRGEASAAQRHRLGGSLNPTWVEWLMGFPTGWTDLEPSATPSCPKSLK